ncbi:hypothetical protein GGP78_000418 [Salinibacter ruber]|nr:hypothetical protein [Salinibacter ruber]
MSPLWSETGNERQAGAKTLCVSEPALCLGVGINTPTNRGHARSAPPCQGTPTPQGGPNEASVSNEAFL